MSFVCLSAKQLKNQKTDVINEWDVQQQITFWNQVKMDSSTNQPKRTHNEVKLDVLV